MLWSAGQRRIDRERQLRMVELYGGVRDGYIAGNVAIGRAVPKGDIRPAYVRGVLPGPSVDGQRATLGRLASLAPGSVLGRDDA